MSDLTRLNMIQLKVAVQQAALSSEEQISKNRGYDVTFEINSDFYNWLRWALNGAERPTLTSEQRDSLLTLDGYFDKINGREHPELWTDEALRNSPEWEEVRRKARDILKVFNWPEEE